MERKTLYSIVFSAFLLGAVVVLLIVREPTIPIVLLTIGVFGQLLTKLMKANKD